jgi:hypothetical protein
VRDVTFDTECLLYFCADSSAVVVGLKDGGRRKYRPGKMEIAARMYRGLRRELEG